MQKQTSNWRKELSILAETGTGSDNGKLNRKKGGFLKKYSMTERQRSWTVDRNIEAESASKSPKNQKV